MASTRSKPNQNSSRQQGLAARRTAVTLVSNVVDDFQTLDQLTDPTSGNRFFLELDVRDQALAKAIALTTLRHQVRIQFALSKVYERRPPQKARILIHALHVAAAQILYMEVPASAAINLAISMIKADRRSIRYAGFANAVLRNLERRQEELLEKTSKITPFPNWILKKLTTDYGKQKMQLSGQIISKEPVVDLTLKPNHELPNTIKYIPLPMGSKRIIEQTLIPQLPDFDKGYWWVQDIAASLAAKLIGDVKGKQVADLCAAPGGKTLQLASLGAQVTSIDQSEKRLQILSDNLNRSALDADIVCADILDWQADQKFDAVLLDAPCSATGTARKNPDVLWNTRPEDVANLANLQQNMIEKSMSLLKSGGILIYANCSLFKDEGENLVSNLDIPYCRLDPISPTELPGLEHCINGQGTVRCLPHLLESKDNEGSEKNGMDGFFIARLFKQ